MKRFNPNQEGRITSFYKLNKVAMCCYCDSLIKNNAQNQDSGSLNFIITKKVATWALPSIDFNEPFKGHYKKAISVLCDYCALDRKIPKKVIRFVEGNQDEIEYISMKDLSDYDDCCSKICIN